ncbi:hypothetical protein Nocox_18420 [Nonomuraea coxensis DSM 45129]|uniref:Transposase n=1 Tax=Nonomuraea coxensis DSM 45129 TaxID=1122611 RepID=A0ABX8U3R4_9ACTN|nr:hypothetical protein [Nonomuraea coxensis]QYC41293.1 hypothetical protein Nocox_18420 [Nonomuraea coxensis DSM 45129]
MLTVVPDPADGARRMLAEALKAEVDAYIAAFADERDEAGRRLVVRNGGPGKPEQSRNKPPPERGFAC